MNEPIANLMLLSLLTMSYIFGIMANSYMNKTLEEDDIFPNVPKNAKKLLVYIAVHSMAVLTALFFLKAIFVIPKGV